jgi:hypothetical protein
MPLLFILSNERMVLKSLVYILKWNTWILAHYMYAVIFIVWNLQCLNNIIG